ncbi:MAG TPA: MFS transporter [Burkholderiales bacterium]|nr:MFS transporter [Burkholderiales bacterium]
MDKTRRSVGLLSACQAMLMANNSTLIAVNGLAGLALAPLPSLATLPVTCWVVGGALATVPASHYMRRVGRQPGLVRGAAIGIAGALLCAAAVWQASFWLLCFGALVYGFFNAFGQYYRFVAAEVAAPESRASAVSVVLAGGLVGGILGPTVSRQTVDLVGPRYTGAYLALIGFVLLTLAILSRLRVPDLGAAAQAQAGRPLAQIARQPKYVVAVMSSALGYGVMNFLMTSTPLAMRACGHPYGDATFVISSHVVAMFAPSFFTGGLIKRFGPVPVMLAGAALNVGSIAMALAGAEVSHFWWALVLLGVGWNFLYIGGTTLLTETYRPEERARAQGANELAIFAMMALSSLSSGMIVTNAGWQKVNYAAAPLVVVIIAGLMLLLFKFGKSSR